MMMKVNAGSAYVRYANAITENLLGTSLGLINEANFKAEMPCPWVFGIGIAYKPVDRLTLAFDARLTGWNTYKSLDIEFLSEQLTPYNQNITKNYKNYVVLFARRTVRPPPTASTSAPDLWSTHRL